MTKIATSSRPRGSRRARGGSTSPSRKPLRISAILAAGSLAACVQIPTASHAVEVVEASIADLHSAIREGRTSCRGVVQAHLDRIEAYDRSSGLHAITEVNSRALERADSIDRTLAGSLPPEDAFMVRRLREAGAIVIAKTNMGEWAFSPRQTAHLGMIEGEVLLGELTDAFGGVLEEVRAPYRGEILSVVGPPPVNRGEAVVFLGRLPDNE